MTADPRASEECKSALWHASGGLSSRAIRAMCKILPNVSGKLFVSYMTLFPSSSWHSIRPDDTHILKRSQRVSVDVVDVDEPLMCRLMMAVKAVNFKVKFDDLHRQKPYVP